MGRKLNPSTRNQLTGRDSVASTPAKHCSEGAAFGILLHLLPMGFERFLEFFSLLNDEHVWHVPALSFCRVQQAAR